MKKEIIDYYKSWTGRLFTAAIIIAGAISGLFLKGLDNIRIKILFYSGLLIIVIALIFSVNFESKLRKELRL